MFSGYIPTSFLLSSDNLKQYQDASVAVMKIQPFNLVGSPFPIKGITEFRLQHVPDTLTGAEEDANYASHTGLGMTRETLHYVNTTSQPIPIEFYVHDSYEGPPHSTTDTDGNIVYQDFQNLHEVDSWLSALTHPVNEWKKPPFVMVSFGRWGVWGVVIKKYPTQWIKTYPNGDAMIAKMGIVVKPDPILVTRDRSFFEVNE